MFRRKKKNRSIRFGITALILLFVFGWIYGLFDDNKEQEVLHTIEESDLNELLAEEESIVKDPDIRVLIKGNGYSGEVHPEIKLVSKGRMCLISGEQKEYIDANEILHIKPDNKKFKDGKIRITSDKKITIESLKRSYGKPAYEGTIELRTTAEGIVVINEVPVEGYLKMVVPSEMPASYELEALKAQAVCARSYAYQQMKEYGYPEYEAHVNDSTDYQVYGNVKPQDASNQAIEETKGQTVYYQGEIATTYFYSTSCGKTTDIAAWGTKKTKENAYLKSVKVKGKEGDYEKNLAWYKWKAEIPIETISNLVGSNAGKDIGIIHDIKVTERGGGDVAVAVKIIGEKGNITVKTENKIRKILGGKGYQIKLNDGTMTDSKELLPSAFFTVKKSGDAFVIEGGGFGHGIGMSQNGANEMAKQGADYIEILELFYQDIEVR